MVLLSLAAVMTWCAALLLCVASHRVLEKMHGAPEFAARGPHLSLQMGTLFDVLPEIRLGWFCSSSSNVRHLIQSFLGAKQSVGGRLNRIRRVLRRPTERDS